MPTNHTLGGRTYKVLARYSDDSTGAQLANDYMLSHPDACVLAVSDGVIVLADRKDLGTPLTAEEKALQARIAIERRLISFLLSTARKAGWTIAYVDDGGEDVRCADFGAPGHPFRQRQRAIRCSWPPNCCSRSFI